MTVIDLLATNLNKRDDFANQALALEIIKGSHSDWIKELVDNFNNKDKNIQSDCIKVLYEIGQNGAPQLIAPYLKEFGNLLNSKNNRLIWGAMKTVPLLIDQLINCPIKQLPMYAEKSLIAVNPENKRQFAEILELRLPETDKESQKKRIEKIIKTLKTKG